MDLPELFIWANAMTEERFVPVKGFETRFWISDFGRIVSHDHRKNTVNFLNPNIGSAGYYDLSLRKKPVLCRTRVHQLVAEYFVKKSNESCTFVNHVFGIKLWNYYKDLEWTTPAGNSKHAVETGLHDLKGSKHPMSKLTEYQVRQIRAIHSVGMTQKAIAVKFGISRRQAGDIVNRKNWGWLN